MMSSRTPCGWSATTSTVAEHWWEIPCSGWRNTCRARAWHSCWEVAVVLPAQKFPETAEAHPQWDWSPLGGLKPKGFLVVLSGNEHWAYWNTCSIWTYILINSVIIYFNWILLLMFCFHNCKGYMPLLVAHISWVFPDNSFAWWYCISFLLSLPWEKVLRQESRWSQWGKSIVSQEAPDSEPSSWHWIFYHHVCSPWVWVPSGARLWPCYLVCH